MLNSISDQCKSFIISGTRNLDVIDLLLAAGIDVNQKNMLGMSAFLLAAGYGNERLVHMILQAGADPKATNDFGNNAIHIAVVGKQVDKLFLKKNKITKPSHGMKWSCLLL